jgi:hypothetical protein
MGRISQIYQFHPTDVVSTLTVTLNSGRVPIDPLDSEALTLGQQLIDLLRESDVVIVDKSFPKQR